jgi:hypothetical protein
MSTCVTFKTAVTQIVKILNDEADIVQDDFKKLHLFYVPTFRGKRAKIGGNPGSVCTSEDGSTAESAMIQAMHAMFLNLKGQTNNRSECVNINIAGNILKLASISKAAYTCLKTSSDSKLIQQDAYIKNVVEKVQSLNGNVTINGILIINQLNNSKQSEQYQTNYPENPELKDISISIDEDVITKFEIMYDTIFQLDDATGVCNQGVILRDGNFYIQDKDTSNTTSLYNVKPSRIWKNLPNIFGPDGRGQPDIDKITDFIEHIRAINRLGKNPKNPKSYVVLEFVHPTDNTRQPHKLAEILPAGGGGSSKVKTKEKFKIGKISHVVYRGPRGGRYIMNKNGTFISLYGR